MSAYQLKIGFGYRVIISAEFIAKNDEKAVKESERRIKGYKQASGQNVYIAELMEKRIIRKDSRAVLDNTA